jgi:molybdate transport system ATP-binding protein
MTEPTLEETEVLPAPPPVLDAHIQVDRGPFRLDLPLRIDSGDVVAVLGPNGSGKTTALRALAGLLPLSAGHIRLVDQLLDDPRQRVFVRPEQRAVGVVFQDYLLFPHLSALENVAFGPRSRGEDRHQARQRAREWLARVGLADLADRKPRALSGGQAQRVALARALVGQPDLLLLDEPLAALDARTRLDTRAALSRHLAENPGATLLVTHDPLDALVLADRLIILENGQVVQEGDAATITAQPRTDYVARLVGLNLYRGSGHGLSVELESGFVFTVTDSVQGAAFVAFAPSAVSLFRREPDGSPRNLWPVEVVGVQRHGDNLRVELSGPVATAADITPAAAVHLDLRPGGQLWAAVKATEIRAYPA